MQKAGGWCSNLCTRALNCCLRRNTTQPDLTKETTTTTQKKDEEQQHEGGGGGSGEDEDDGDEVDTVDDNFDLPVSLALLILILYMAVGCIIYPIWEDWTYFEACYFIFISMTTIGFGDFVPQVKKMK